jgi:hypothetical protein
MAVATRCSTRRRWFGISARQRGGGVEVRIAALQRAATTMRSVVIDFVRRRVPGRQVAESR